MVRISQAFAKCETTFSAGYGAIGGMKSDSPEAVAARLLALRMRIEPVQQEFARHLGMAKNTYHGFESGNRPLTLNAAVKIRRRYGVSLDWLLFGDMAPTGTDLMLQIGSSPETAPKPRKATKSR